MKEVWKRRKEKSRMERRDGNREEQEEVAGGGGQRTQPHGKSSLRGVDCVSFDYDAQGRPSRHGIHTTVSLAS